MKKLSLKKKFKRVDFQVSGIILMIVTLSFLCVYFTSYTLTYTSMLTSLRNRSNSIYEYLEEEFDMSKFMQFSKKEDAQSEEYLKVKEDLTKIKKLSDVLYLYTAKKTNNGDYVYVIDGLPMENEDFRYPGSLIETEIIPKMNRALENEIVYPDDIMNTEWGPIFITYYPVHENGEVIGVLGIEFYAQQEYATFHKLKIGTFLIGIVFALAAIAISIYLFRRLSNPSFKDFASSDYLTGLKNRNAFELDIQNHKQDQHWFQGLLIIDLNGLKAVNDDYGHAMGDMYIKCSATMLSEVCHDALNIYRIGGDEFAIIYEIFNEEKGNKIIEEINRRSVVETQKQHIKISLAMGYAIYNHTSDVDFYDMYKRADKEMYKRKQAMRKHTKEEEK